MNVFGNPFAEPTIRTMLDEQNVQGSFWICRTVIDAFGWPEPRGNAGVCEMCFGRSVFRLFNNADSIDFTDEVSAAVAVALRANMSADYSCATLPRSLAGDSFNLPTTGCLSAVKELRAYPSRLWLTEEEIATFGTSVESGELNWGCFPRCKIKAGKVGSTKLYNASQTKHPELFTDHHFRCETHQYFHGHRISSLYHDSLNDFCIARQLAMRIPFWGTRSDFKDYGYTLPEGEVGQTISDKFDEELEEVFNPEQLGDRIAAVSLSNAISEATTIKIPFEFLYGERGLGRRAPGMEYARANASRAVTTSK